MDKNISEFEGTRVCGVQGCKGHEGHKGCEGSLN